jgi:hypothetical protein
MKMRIDMVPRSDQAPEYHIPDLSPQRQERIVELTMKKIQKKRRRSIRTVRIACVAAVVILLLCGSAFAYAKDWFGFADIFGEKNKVVEDHVAAYTGETDVQATQQTYGEEEQKQIEEGTLTVPDQAALLEDGIGASTEDYQYTLEEMLASDNTLYAIVRVDAQSEAAKEKMLDTGSDALDAFRFFAYNMSGEGKEREFKNGAMNCKLLTSEGDTAYFLLSNVGGQFAVDDTIRFNSLADNVDLFDVPLTQLMDTEATISLDTLAYAGKGYQWDTMTVTPISLELRGTYENTSDYTIPELTVTLKDGTTFELASNANDFQYTEYGTYGSLTFSGTAGDWDDPFLLNSWGFSQVVDLGEIASITVDGVAYEMDG